MEKKIKRKEVRRRRKKKNNNKAGYTAQDAPSTRLKTTQDRRTYRPTDGPTDGRTDGHDLL